MIQSSRDQGIVSGTLGVDKCVDIVCDIAEMA